MRAVPAFLTIVFVCCTASAVPTDTATAEIEHLLAYLGSSSCTFNRNGTWYSAAEAVDHLRGKYEYLLRKELVTSAESFIDQAASRSSMSGNPYLVRCGSAQPIESGTWFRAELTRFRDTERATVNNPPQPTSVSSPRSSPDAAEPHR